MAGKVRLARKRIKRGNFKTPSPEEVLAARSPAGAWTAAQLADWGIKWPPHKGWRTTLLHRWHQEQAAPPVPHKTTRNYATNPLRARRLSSAGEDIVITAGVNQDGSLVVHRFTSRAEAAAAGFGWAGQR
jgi:hypothetical protein